MDYLMDLHTHTIASGHAYSTISEMIDTAAQKGLKLFGITEHAPAMPGTCNELYYLNFRVIPRHQQGMQILLGSEVNIIDLDGSMDFDDKMLDIMDLVIASMHTPCLTPGSREENTRAYLNVMNHPKVTIIGHPDDGRYPIDAEAFVKEAKETKTVIEVNNNSLNPRGFRQNSKENYKTILKYCEKYEVPVVVNSDAHICYDVANFGYAKRFFQEIDFPKELVLNFDVDVFLSYLK